jgi:hypothetical protein
MTLQEYEVKRVDPFSFGKISAAFTALIGILSGLIYLPFGLVLMGGGLNMGSGLLISALAFLVGGLFLTIFLAAIYAGVGFAFGVFYGYIYNYISGKVGGLEMVMDIEG